MLASRVSGAADVAEEDMMHAMRVRESSAMDVVGSSNDSAHVLSATWQARHE